MKLGEVVKITGLSKRTIYFYIEEHFLAPEVNPANGYYNFSLEDVERLKMLQQLRKADFSIKDIHEILKHPMSAYIYIQKQVEMLKKERELLAQKIKSLQNLYDRLPMFVSGKELSDAVFDTDFPDKSVIVPTDLNSDASLVSLYLWGPFLNDITMTEYRKYLWNKILIGTARFHSESLGLLKEYLYSLTAEDLDSEFNGRAKHIAQFAELTLSDIPKQIDKIKNYIIEISEDKKFAAMWKRDYNSRILPTTILYDAEFNALVSELSPKFSSYYENIHKCCDLIYDWLLSENGGVVKERLVANLGGYIDLRADHHAQIAALFGMIKI